MITYTYCVREKRQVKRRDLFAALHNQDVKPEINSIRVRKGSNRGMETAARQLFQTVKDHNSVSIQDMVDISNIYHYRNAAGSSDSNSEDKEDEEFYPVHFPTANCCFILVSY